MEGDEGATTLYLRLEKPAGMLTEEVFLGFFFAGRRQFRRFIDSNRHLRTLEIVDGVPRRVCTLDLRAWSESTELCFATQWTSDSFSVAIWSPDESTQLWARAVTISQPEVE